MRKWLSILLLSVVAVSVSAQSSYDGRYTSRSMVEEEDSILVVHIPPIYKFSRRADMRRYMRLIRAVKKVYPIAQEAKREMALMEAELSRLPSKRDREVYIKGIQKMIIKQYMHL